MKGNIPKAIALLSGGLDSILAAKLVKDLGVEVVGLHLTTPFGGRSDNAKASALEIDIPLIVRPRGEAFLDLVKKPHYGYGKNMNPCIDCRIGMFLTVKQVMEEEKADFIITGEVLGQRPMSQRRFIMSLIDRKSETQGLILRPLSAKCFRPTVAEEQGWVDRESLLFIKGRSRQQQYALAEKWGLTQFSSPGGGCLLTEKTFVPKLKDFFEYEPKDYRLAQCELLRFGRHFRLSEKTKVILGRDEKENMKLESRWRLAGGSYFTPTNFPGPDAVVLGPLEEGDRTTIAKMMAYYGKTKELDEMEIMFESLSSENKQTLRINSSLSLDDLDDMRI